MKFSSRGEEEVRIYQDEDHFALSEDVEVGLYLEDNGYVVVEDLRGALKANGAGTGRYGKKCRDDIIRGEHGAIRG